MGYIVTGLIFAWLSAVITAAYLFAPRHIQDEIMDYIQHMGG